MHHLKQQLRFSCALTSLVLLVGAVTSSCTDKRHDCEWLGTCGAAGGEAGDSGVGGATAGSTGGTGGTGGTVGAGGTVVGAGGSSVGGSAGRSAGSSGMGVAGNAGMATSAGGAGVAGAAGNASSAGNTSNAGTAGTQPQAGTAGAAGNPEPPCSGHPKEACSISVKYGVFVSPLGDDNFGDGSPDKPLRSLERGLTKAKSDKSKTPLNVYLCADTATKYELATPVTLTAENADGVAVYGDFSCKSTTWLYDPTLRAAFISAKPTAFRVEGITTGLSFENVSISAADATTAGESSVAVLAVNSPALSLARVDITAGKGVKGADGTGYTVAATSGTPGEPGLAACFTGIGAASVTTICDGGEASVGAKGGTGGIGAGVSAGNGNNGTPQQSSVPDAGIGGFGEVNDPCVDGTRGASGDAGTPALGGTVPGWLSATLGFVPSDGKDGVPGKPGQGGGGGGGAKSPATCSGMLTPTGASGASGGSGGCGGKAGSAGKGGGASIALALINSPIKLSDSTLTAKAGGAGGKGGAGQSGGPGGVPGAYGAGAGSNRSCAGGFGGDGGSGSSGGGGAGGASLAVAYTGTVAPTETSVTHVTAAAAALGGDGGGSATTTSAGAVGKVADVLQLGLQ